MMMIPSNNMMSTLSVVPRQKKKGKRSGSFSSEEDELLVSAWLNTSLDAIHSTDHKIDRYWDRVHAFFHAHGIISSKRSSNSLMNRWSVIQKAVNKFCGCYAQIEGRKQSGITEHDKTLHARAMYTQIYKRTFKFEHWWNMLKSEPKWLVNVEKDAAPKKKRKIVDVPSMEASTPNVTSLENENPQDASTVKNPRPSGKKQDLENMKNKKSKVEVDDTIIGLMEQMKDERKNSSSVRTELLEKILAIEQKKEEERIMSIDLTGISELQVEYYTKRQKEIVEKLK